MANIVLMKEQLKQFETLNRNLKEITARLESVNGDLENLLTKCDNLSEISDREIKKKFDGACCVYEYVRCDVVGSLKELSEVIDIYLTPLHGNWDK